MFDSNCHVYGAEEAIVEVIDIREEAAASRDHLASDIAQVASDRLRAQLLDLQCRDNNDCRLAHWYAGEVQVSGEWKSLDEARQLAADDPELTDYYKLRDKSRDAMKDHEILAKWCRKHELPDLERLHWLHVLRFQSHHHAALNVLNLVWHKGVLLKEGELKHQFERERLISRQKKEWKAKVKQLRRALEQGEPEQRLVAKKEIREIRDPAAVPALLEVFQAQSATEAQTAELRGELMASLGKIPAPEAVETLVNNAVFASAQSVRYAAANQLRSKQYAEYLPLLLSELEMPIEVAVSFEAVGNRIVTSYSYAQEDATGTERERFYRNYRTIPGPRYIATPLYTTKVSPKKLVQKGYWAKAQTIPAYMCGGYLVPERHIPRRYVAPRYSGGVLYREHVSTAYFDDPGYEKNKQLTLQYSKSQAIQSDARLVQLNERIQQKNERIAEVMAELTGERFGADPKRWWNWWSDYLDRHPDMAAMGLRQDFNTALLNQEPRGLARGAWVWTQQGKRAVETILPGDFVLSQNPYTGELAHKVVLAIQAPRQIEVRKIEFNGRAMHFAPGHVVWAAGLGWQKVSNLAAGQRLHGVNNEPKIEEIREGFGLDGYDIVVEGFSTLFVGEQGVLVHDATLIRPTHTALPGFSPAAVAEAAHLAAVP
ncbi:MAG: hypothetical protein IH831_05590 [Planctomycetes bacterium]|nr:hypothetical protein [Planctomycetota bacterium]